MQNFGVFSTEEVFGESHAILRERVVENNSPITCQWKADQLIESQTSSAKSYDTIYVTKTGSNIIKLVCHNTGVDFTKEFTVNVDEITLLSDGLKKRLGSVSSFTSTFDPSKVEIKQMLKDGEEGQGNLFQVINNSSQLSDWRLVNKSSGEVACTASNNSDMVYTMDPGTYNIMLDYTKADGTTETYNAGEFNVPAVTYIPEVIVYLRGGKAEAGPATTKWQWFQGNAAVWGNGPWASGGGPAWWTNNLDSMDGNGGGKPGGAAVNGDGTSCSFKVYPLKHAGEADWDQGCISFGVSGDKYVIPMGVNVNGGDQPFEDFYILKAKDGRLTVTAPEQAMNGCAWFMLFQQVTE